MCSDNERDDFWNVEKLVPKKKSTLSPFASRITTVETVISGEEERDATDKKINFDLHKSELSDEISSYAPENAGLIKRVTVRRLLDRYDFYGAFRNSALLYYDCKGDKCDFVAFYSYMPQYSQLTQDQRNYYFYWRALARQSKYIKCDYSYLYLYVYEILNLPEKYPPKEAIIELCRLWTQYRAALPRIDAYFSLWIQDYCLIYNLRCPIDEIREFIFDVIASSSFKEFYISNADYKSDGDLDALIAYLSDYDWRRGKYAGGDNRELYSRYMHEAMKRLFFHLGEDGLLCGGGSLATTRRDAFAHSLCTHTVKCKLEIEYIPLSRDASLRSTVTEAVRYTENRLRAIFGIKSRLAVRALPEKYKRTIDRYFDELIAEQKRKTERENAPAYERLYDAPAEKLSFAGADAIEQSSWSTTARLVAEDDIIEPASVYVEDVEASEKKSSEETDESIGLSNSDINALRALLDGECDLKNHTVAERINNAFIDIIGDIVLEPFADSYTVIEDYREDIAKWLRK